MVYTCFALNYIFCNTLFKFGFKLIFNRVVPFVMSFINLKIGVLKRLNRGNLHSSDSTWLLHNHTEWFSVGAHASLITKSTLYFFKMFLTKCLPTTFKNSYQVKYFKISS